MAGHSHYSEPTGPVGPAPQEHNVVYTTLHFDKPWSYENYLKTGGYSALRKILSEKIEPAAVIGGFGPFRFRWKSPMDAPLLDHAKRAGYVRAPGDWTINGYRNGEVWVRAAEPRP